MSKWLESKTSVIITVKPLLRGHLWDKKKWSFKTGDLLKEVQFIWSGMFGDFLNLVVFFYISKKPRYQHPAVKWLVEVEVLILLFLIEKLSILFFFVFCFLLLSLYLLQTLLILKTLPFYIPTGKPALRTLFRLTVANLWPRWPFKRGSIHMKWDVRRLSKSPGFFYIS
jgi:hypothetical protein